MGSDQWVKNCELQETVHIKYIEKKIYCLIIIELAIIYCVIY